MNQLNQQQLAQHITIVGWLHIVGNLFFVLIGLFLYFFLNTIGAVSGDPDAVVILSAVGAFVGALLTILGLPGIVAGFGLLACKPWARYLAIVLSILNLLNVPVGTVMGSYSLWVLLQDTAATYFAPARASASAALVQP